MRTIDIQEKTKEEVIEKIGGGITDLNQNNDSKFICITVLDQNENQGDILFRLEKNSSLDEAVTIISDISYYIQMGEDIDFRIFLFGKKYRGRIFEGEDLKEIARNDQFGLLGYDDAYEMIKPKEKRKVK